MLRTDQMQGEFQENPRYRPGAGFEAAGAWKPEKSTSPVGRIRQAQMTERLCSIALRKYPHEYWHLGRKFRL